MACGAVGLHHVGDEQIDRRTALHGNMHDGARARSRRERSRPSFSIRRALPAATVLPSTFAVTPWPPSSCTSVTRRGVDVLAVGALDAQGDGVLGPALGQRGGFHAAASSVTPSAGVDARDLKGALGQGAGLIKHHDAGAGQLFQIGGALDEDAAGGSAADAAEEAQRDGDDQRAGAADDQEGQGAVDPVAKAGGLAHEQQHDRRQNGQRQCAVADGGGVDAGKAGDEVLGAGLLHAGIFHQVENFGDGGFAELLGGAHLQQAGHVHAAADDLVAGAARRGAGSRRSGRRCSGRKRPPRSRRRWAPARRAAPRCTVPTSTSSGSTCSSLPSSSSMLA